jgi:pimeloyl-ACP methyl ester carboxylesterase
LSFERAGARLSVRDFGGRGTPVLLLHGLAGHGEEWGQTASWLTHEHRVLALDARGHGFSERRPVDVSRAAHVADAAAVIERTGRGPTAVVGQSLGGHTALLLAASRPELVSRLVVVEASPAGDPAGAAEAASAIETALRSWPVPFADHSDAITFFTARFGSALEPEALATNISCKWESRTQRYPPARPPASSR